MLSKYPVNSEETCQNRAGAGNEQRKGKHDQDPGDREQADQRTRDGDGSLARWRHERWQTRREKQRNGCAQRRDDDLRHRIPRDSAVCVGEPENAARAIGIAKQENAENDCGVDAAECQRQDEQPTDEAHWQPGSEVRGKEYGHRGVRLFVLGWTLPKLDVHDTILIRPNA